MEDQELEGPEVTPRQEWLDKWLASLSDEQLVLLYQKAAKLSKAQKDQKAVLMDQMRSLHETWMLEQPKRLRFSSPAKGMVGARSRELWERRQKTGEKPGSFGAPPRTKSVLDLE